MGADYYKLLGVDKNASEDDIKKAYKKMVRTLNISRSTASHSPPRRSSGIPTGIKTRKKRQRNSKRCVTAKIRVVHAFLRQTNYVDIRGVRGVER